MNNGQESAMHAVMNFLRSYSEKDVEKCMSAIATSKPVMMMGTNDNEVFASPPEIREAFRKDFANMDDIRWGEPRHAHTEASEKLAFVIVELPVTFRSEGEEVKTLFRYAPGLVPENGGWKIFSGIASVPFKSGTCTFQDFPALIFRNPFRAPPL